MMTVDEMSYEFDVLASSYFREGGFTLSDSSLLAFNDYEKSVFLTREQEALVQSLYSDRSAIGSFEKTEQLRRDLENLLASDVVEPVQQASSSSSSSNDPYYGGEQHIDEQQDTVPATHIVSGSQFFKLPSNLWYIVYEAGRYSADSGMNCPDTEDGFPVEVIPVTYDNLHRVQRNPFRRANKWRALRLDNGKSVDNYVELISATPLAQYYVKYIRRPEPIILVDLPDGLKINGKDKTSECELHESLHRLVLDGAVRMAVSSRVGQGSQKSEQS